VGKYNRKAMYAGKKWEGQRPCLDVIRISFLVPEKRVDWIIPYLLYLRIHPRKYSPHNMERKKWLKIGPTSNPEVKRSAGYFDATKLWL
jgi:hypothetical protein